MNMSFSHFPAGIVRLLSAILIIPAPLGDASAEDGFPFPGRAENLSPGHYWFLQKKHAAGIQGLGYDLGAGVRFDAEKQKWVGTNLKTSGDSCTSAPSNSDCIIYGQPAYAIADGEVLSCWRNAPENPAPGQKRDDIGDWDDPAIGKGVPSGGNLLKVDQGNGQVVLYAHFRPGSVPKSLCPIEDEFQTPAQTGVLPAGNRPKVKKGQKIGEVGNSGASSRPHLHIHMIKVQPGADKALPLRFHSAWIKSTSKDEDSPTDWVRLKGEALSNPPVAILPDYSTGLPEIARHGVRSSDYQFTFDHIAGSGYRLEWIDGFNVKGKLYFNVIFRPDDGTKRVAFHNLTGSQYQTEYDKHKNLGYRLYQIDSYPTGNQVLYAAIFAKDGGPQVTAYHGIPTAEHQTKFDELTAGDSKPKNISVVSLNGNRLYTALYEKISSVSSEAKSFLTPEEYQKESDDNKQKGRQLIYLNAYEHNGAPRFTAIWRAGVSGSFKARHDLSASEYQDEWESALKSGLLTRAVTGYVDGNAVRYAAVWRK